MIALGLTNGEIAGRLGVTVHAVKFHLGHIYRKLGVSNRTEAAVAFGTVDARVERDDRQESAAPDWNDTARAYPEANVLLHELFERQVRGAPEGVAVRFRDGELTYAELDER